jgi:RHS repeat-associated protein
VISAHLGDYNELLYLRARFYVPNIGRFSSLDTWSGNANFPMTFNRWNYVHSNPISFPDPSGHIEETEAKDAFDLVRLLQDTYGVNIVVDWGYEDSNTGMLISFLPIDPIHLAEYGYGCAIWGEGRWSLGELRIVKYALEQLNSNTIMKGRFKNLVGKTTIALVPQTVCGSSARGCTSGNSSLNIIEFKDKGKPPSPNYSPAQNIIDSNINFDVWSVTHELGHALDQHHHWLWSLGMLTKAVGAYYWFPQDESQCDPYHELPGCNDAGYYYGSPPPKTSGTNFNHIEDFAESVTAYVYPNEAWGEMWKQLGTYAQDPLVSQGLYDRYYSFLYYDNFRSTPRGKYIAGLIGR